MQSEDYSLYPQGTITKALPIASIIEPSMFILKSQSNLIITCVFFNMCS